MGYTDLIFDLYGTLVDIHTEENEPVWEKTALFFSYYGASYSGPQLERRFHEVLAQRSAQAGQSYECYPDIPVEQIMAQLLREQGIGQKANALGFQAAQLFRVLSTDYLRLYPHVTEALQALRARGCRLWLLSNAQRAFTAYELKALGLDSAFDGIYISSDYGCRKPDPRFFRALLTQQQLEPRQCLMIGNDRLTDIAGAKAVGLDTLYMHTALTPADQSAADPSVNGKGHYEFEGDDWLQLLPVLCKLLDQAV